MSIERLLEAARAFDAGRLDQAERIYRQVAQVDPRSSIALVGLARVALQRGGEDGAVEGRRLAEAALVVDPDNAAARRLLDDDPGNPRAAGDSDGGPTGQGVDEPFPWPDLDEQLARYGQHGPGRLGRLLRRGRG